MNLELRPLRYFVAVAEELNFTRAADRLFLAQPSLSQQITKLESDLGVRLLERTQRRVALTPAGEVMLEWARRLLAESEALLREVRAAGGQREDRFALGYIEDMNLPFVAPALARWHGTHPDVRETRLELNPAQQLEALLEHRADIGFSPVPLEHPDLRSKIVLRAHRVVILPIAHPLATLEVVPLEALANEGLILFARRLNEAYFDWFLEQCRAWGFEPRVAYETAQSLYAPYLVRDGVGVFITASYLPSLPDGVVARALTGFDTAVTVRAVWRRDNKSALLRDFLQALETVTG
jgi:DNA-binding transcriptional LysR family regulator